MAGEGTTKNQLKRAIKLARAGGADEAVLKEAERAKSSMLSESRRKQLEEEEEKQREEEDKQRVRFAEARLSCGGGA